ncbi:glucose-6-phosphate dehydrogenase [Kamptonema animale CS-326]|jgi:glucose-6-phosphate 1-dehydrogenase|uniref:glucose-6-phosphate dehydrogenase n=1 Tax=Kamptonema animale TaxID=92934 RepID=UPI0023303262|nr:glucose-6-phosphate dehydrogenase [Kamptonema animale]MDB9511897.1 glucose-6-phosphate dehydrogenase [Kamptonema animale CS-326]
MVTLLENPLRVGLRQERMPDPQILVIFGASGDLTQRKLVPAIYQMKRDRRMPPEITVVGVARRPWSHDYFREQMRQGIEEFGEGIGPEDFWKDFAQGLYYFPGDIDNPESYEKLKVFLAEIDEKRRTRGNRVFYLSVSPNFFPEAIRQLGAAGMLSDPSKQRLVIEKPFGRDLSSAKALNRVVQNVCTEQQVYRIDHYLGKETVQNLMVFRFANAIFEPLWNRHYVDHVQITVAETVGVEDRAGYYESAGALRDMLQNHLMQIFCLTAMEPPNSLDADSIRTEKLKVLQASRLADVNNLEFSAVRGQYSAGWMKGKPVPGYREEPGVDPNSGTPTYVAMKFMVDNWRWQGVPFYLRTGKRLPKKISEIAIQFREVPLLIFQSAAQQASPNVLTMRVYPNEGISLRFEGKRPGPDLRTRTVDMDFSYGSSFGVTSSDAYDRLLVDCMLGDQTLFTRADEVEEAWRLVTPALTAWETPTDPSLVPQYEAGTWEPAEAEQLINRDGRRWRRV